MCPQFFILFFLLKISLPDQALRHTCKFLISGIFCTVLNFFLSVGCEDRDILWAIFTILSIESIYLSLELCEKWPYLQNYHSKFVFLSTQCIILLLFLLFSKMKIVGAL